MTAEDITIHMSEPRRTDARWSALPVADSHDLIRVQGARVNNLKDVSIELPKRRLTCSPVSPARARARWCSARSPAESQRMINEPTAPSCRASCRTLSAGPRSTSSMASRPRSSSTRSGWGTNPRSTVGTATDAKRCCASCSAGSGSRTSARPTRTRSTSPGHGERRPSPSNAGAKTKTEKATLHSPRRHVPTLRGQGLGHRLRPVRLYDDAKSLNEGAITIPGYSPWTAGTAGIFRGCGFFDLDKPIRGFTRSSGTTCSTRSRPGSRWTDQPDLRRR